MTLLELHAGPRLLRRRWESRLEGESLTDVTANAAQYLFEPTELKGATLADLFRLVELNPVLREVYHRDFIDEYLAEVAKGPLAADPEEDPDERIEYLELYNQWELDTSTNVYDAATRPCFHGIGVERVKDSEHYPAGSRTNWGLMGSSVRSLLSLEVRFNPELVVTENDIARKNYGRVVRKESLPPPALGALLSGVFWELSFHGSPASTQEVSENLKAQSDAISERGTVLVGEEGDAEAETEVKAEGSADSLAQAEDDDTGPVRVVSADTVFGDLYTRSIARNFVSTSLKASLLYRFLGDLDDDVVAAPALEAHFGAGTFVLHPECAEMTAYQLRRRAADRFDD